MGFVDMHMLAEPDAAHDAATVLLGPFVLILVNRLPRTIIIVEGYKAPCNTRVGSIQQLPPALVGLLVELLLQLHHFIVLIESGFLHLQRIVTHQRVC